MTVSYLEGFDPIWYVPDNFGNPASGGQLTTYDANTLLLRPTYTDSTGAVQNTNPIVFSANGTFPGPIFFQLDTSVPNDGYFLQMKDNNGNLLWTVNNYQGAGGSGGGGGTNTPVDIINFITNGQLWRASNTLDAFFATSVQQTLAPSNHDAFVSTPQTLGAAAPDVIFAKNNTNATDQLKFEVFSPFGATPFTNDVTPQYSLRYQCTVLGGGETYKYVQFPICPKVSNFSNQIMTVTLWALWNGAGNTQIQVYARQFFGDSGGSADVRTLLGTITATNVWTQYKFTASIPSVAGKTIGACNNDGLFIQFQYALSATTDINIAKPGFYLGAASPAQEFDSMDQIDALVNSPRVGDVKTGFSATAPLGWISMNDGSIGSVSSGATTRANLDTFPLFNLLWNGVSNTYAPVSGGRGASSVADYAANKTLTMPLSLGRALAGAGSGAGLAVRTLGESLGNEAISIAQMPAHTHTVGISVGTGASTNTVGNNGSVNTGTQNTTTASTGGSATDGNMPPTSFMNVFIKL